VRRARNHANHSRDHQASGAAESNRSTWHRHLHRENVRTKYDGHGQHHDPETLLVSALMPVYICPKSGQFDLQLPE
jgi:hypothetical protein